MRLIALSNYNNDTDIRFGDCILLVDTQALVVYDCGHEDHADYVGSFLEDNSDITDVHIVVSHNDSDHTDGVCTLLNWLSYKGRYTVTVYTHQYLKHLDEILDKIDDGRRSREKLKEALLDEFDNIKKIIEKANDLDFTAKEALSDTDVGDCQIVGPTVEEFTDVAAKAVDNREGDDIGEGNSKETVMNAASVQLKCELDDGETVLLCGDASPDYLKNIKDYSIIQLPHHGQLDDAKAIFEKLKGDAYCKEYLISDNTGSAENSGGSDDLVKYMKEEKYAQAYNTKNGVVNLPKKMSTDQSKSQRRKCLGDMDSVKRVARRWIRA